MLRKDLYDKTVGILVDAYFKDTLESGNYCGCAVGNLIAANMGINITTWKRDDNSTEVSWEGVNDIDASQWLWLVYKDKYCLSNQMLAIKQVKSTGYSIEEIIKIENAFENCWDINEEDEMFVGLMAVIEVLDEIHENTDTSLTTQTKNRFQKELV